MKVLNPTDFCNVENYSKIFKDRITDIFVSLEKSIDFYNNHVFSIDLVDMILEELYKEYGVEKNDENFIKLKKEIYKTIACKMMDLADSLNRIAREYRVK